MLDRDLVDEILHRADIVTVISSYINVIKKGRSYVAVCPFHDDKNPSLNISKEKQIYKCFSCGNGGNVFTFVQNYEKVNFVQAVKKVADIIGFHDPRLDKDAAAEEKVDPEVAKLYACINDLAKYYQYSLTIPEGEKARAYFEKRHLTEHIQKYGLGYAPLDGVMTIKYLQAKKHSLKSIEDIGICLVRPGGDTSDHNAGRIIFPLYGPTGQIVGFSARQMEKDGSAKYINTPETLIFHKGKLLYNYHNAARTARHDGYCYVLEGFMDVMALDKAGISSAVALCGTAMTKDHVAMLRKLHCEIRLCLDGDGPGQMAMMKIITLLSNASVPFRLVSNPGDLRDPDEILQADGPEVLVEKMNHLVEPYDFQIDYYENTKKLETPEDRAKVLNHFLPYLRKMPIGIERENTIVRLAKATRYEPDAIRAMLKIKTEDEMDEDNAIFVEKTIGKRIHPEKRLLDRLFMAERTVLYYMLSEEDAIAFYETTIRGFNNQAYEDIANYILEYQARHPDEGPNISGIAAEIASSEAENAEKLTNDVSVLALESGRPPYSRELLGECAKVIAEEKSKISERLAMEKAIQSSDDPRETAAQIAEYAKRKRQRWGEKKK